MKKTIITSLFSLFILMGTSISAQTSEKVAKEIDTVTKSAIMSIKGDKTLSDPHKEKFILRIETVATAAKKRDDASAISTFSAEYKRISDSYARVASKPLPENTIEKKED